jgi:glucose-6-phosphate isomerase
VKYVQEIDGCMADAIGGHGLSSQEFVSELEGCEKALGNLRRACERGELPALDSEKSLSALEALSPLAENIRKDFKTVLVLGVGGSSLGGRTLSGLLEAPLGDRVGPRLSFLDNIDPNSVERIIKTLDLAATLFLVISKSGRTLSTLAQFLICYEAVSGVVGNPSVSKNFIVVTETTDNPLRRCAERMSVMVLGHDSAIGGRFSVFSTAGLVPALIAGVNCREVLEGGASALEDMLGGAPAEVVEPARGAALIVGLAKRRKITTSILMPYCDRLRCFGLWYQQLVAESLGKEGTGILPINAAGTVDQHSQLQLFLDGPRDKMVTFIGVDNAGLGRLIPSHFVEPPEEEIFKNCFLGDLFEAEYESTARSLTSAGRPIRRFRLDRLEERGLGALLMHFMMEIILVGDRFGVNPFNQPAVEIGKALTRELLLDAP